MQCNVGKCDKKIRIVVGIVILAAGLYYESWWGLIGIIPLVTAFKGYCPLYTCCKMNTGKKKEKESQE